MPTTLSIENAPDDVVARLRRRADRHHRSLQSELLTILETAASADGVALESGEVSLKLLFELEDLGLRQPSESTRMIREDRDR